jgi:DNA-binding transcriptional LysR family regulator
MLDQVTSMRVFVRVAAVGSLAGAGRALGLSQTAVTNHVDAIERRLGVTLLHRTTRRLTLTEAGRSYLEACERILAEIEDAEAAANAGQAEARGLLRMNVPVSFGTLQVAPRMAAFAALHPRVTVEFGMTDRVVDLLEEGWDLAIRVGRLPDSGLVSRPLAPCRMVVAASPAYLAEQGVPLRVADLEHHECLGAKLAEAYGPTHWGFGERGEVRVAIRGRFLADNGDALRRAALAGLGIVYQPTFILGEDIAEGRLVALPLDHSPLAAGQVQAVFLRDRRMPLKTRAMIDFLAAEFGPEPPWDQGSACAA